MKLHWSSIIIYQPEPKESIYQAGTLLASKGHTNLDKQVRGQHHNLATYFLLKCSHHLFMRRFQPQPTILAYYLHDHASSMYICMLPAMLFWIFTSFPLSILVVTYSKQPGPRDRGRAEVGPALRAPTDNSLFWKGPSMIWPQLPS